MKLYAVPLAKVPKGRTGDAQTKQDLLDFLGSVDENTGEQVMAAEVRLEANEKTDNERAGIQAAIDKYRFPIRVTSQKDKASGVVTLFIKRDESVLPEIDDRNARKVAAAEKAKADRKAAKAAQGNGNTETVEVTSDVVEPDVSEPKSRRAKANA